MLGKIKGSRRKGKQRMRRLDNITNSMDVNLRKLGDSEGQGSLVCYSPWGCKTDTTYRLNTNNNKRLRSSKDCVSCFSCEAGKLGLQDKSSNFFCFLIFAILYWFLPYDNMNQPYYTYITSLLSPPSHPSRSAHSTRLSFMCYLATSHQLSTHTRVRVLMPLSPLVPLTPSHTVSTSPFSTPAFPFLPCK